MKKYKIILVALVASISFSSCEDWLDVQPEQSISEELAFSTPETASAVMLGGYTGMFAQAYYGRDMIIAPELLADNAKISLNNSGRLLGESTNDERSHIGDQAFWTACYDVINRVNLMLANIESTPGLSQGQIDQFRGESYFLRGLVYFDLARVYGRNPNFLINNFDLGAPILLTPFDGLDEDAFPARATINEVYNQSKADLTQAIALLGNSGQPFRGSQVAAKALLSRVHLYLQEWQDAADLATEAINESGLTLTPQANYFDIFTNDSEALFSLRITINESLGNNNSIAVLYVLSPDGSGYGDAIVRQNLLDAFEAGDVRRDSIQTTLRNGQLVENTLKFNSYGGSIGEDNIPIIRLSEVYLNRAEALAELGGGNEAAALADLNAIRNRAGLPNATSSGAALIQDILDERRIELAFEGHRFFDLKRRGLDITKGNPVDDCVVCTIPYSDYRVVAAIQQAELDVNPNLVNNPGYGDN
ncbi:RagB/SusD family nutrient uptake outer membrane protein [Ekhidna sp. To15]|uniref:RagB/SusD family nutrient uptake outer membrane protein n=1 Tax=Ekhidna sp. To15 TaxID=3395267 RepID=UPI003F51F72C